MRLTLENAETMNQLVKEGELLLKTFHAAECLYRDSSEDIVNRAVIRTQLPIPGDEAESGANHGL